MTGIDDWHAWTVMDRILHIDYRQTDRLTDGRTLVLVKLLSRLKTKKYFQKIRKKYKIKDNEQKIGKNYIFLRKFCKKLYIKSENMAIIDALFTKSLTFLRFILNFPTPPAPESLKIYTHALVGGSRLSGPGGGGG